MANYSKLKVLIVDDVATVRTVLIKSLSKLEITNARESDCTIGAWEKLSEANAQKSPFDLIFCDWNMTNGDGIDLLKRLRSQDNKEFSLSKFFMVTGSNNKVITAMDEGANNIIHKPFTIQIIKTKLELVFGA